MRQNDPEQENIIRPHHPTVALLDSDYTWNFPLISLNPHRGKLPHVLYPSIQFINDLKKSISAGPSSSPFWRNKQDHIINHGSEMEELRQIHIQLISKSKLAISALRDTNINQSAIDQIESEVKNFENIVTGDATQAYILMPYVILDTLINLTLAIRLTGRSDLRDTRLCMHVFLLYPQRDADQLNVNITFKGHVQRNGTRVVYTALAGYHFGISDTFANSGRPTPAVYLARRAAVTTMFGDTVASLTEPLRAGLMTVLRPDEQPPQ